MSATAQNYVYRCSMKDYEKINKPTLTKEEIQKCIESTKKIIIDKRNRNASIYNG